MLIKGINLPFGKCLIRLLNLRLNVYGKKQNNGPLVIMIVVLPAHGENFVKNY